jgi:hypothetical protein
MALTLPDDQQSTLSLAIVDKKGEPAAPASPPSWTVSDPNLLSLTTSSDGLSCVVAAGALGGVTLPATAQVTVHVEGDATPGKDTIVGTLDVNLVGGEAATVTISAGPLAAAGPASAPSASAPASATAGSAASSSAPAAGTAGSAPSSTAPAPGTAGSAPSSSAPAASTVASAPSSDASAAGAAVPAQ